MDDNLRRKIRMAMEHACVCRESAVMEFGEISATRLAETIAIEYDVDHFLDDDVHPIWDLALDISEYYNERMMQAR